MLKGRKFDMIIRSYTKEDYCENQQIVIYGAGVYGELAIKGLEFWGIKASYFADNNDTIKEYFGLPVIAPCDIKLIKNAVVLLASVNYLDEMVKFLMDESISNYFDILEILSTNVYKGALTEYAQDAKNSVERYRYQLDNMNKNKFTVGNIDLVITECCNLKCTGCGSLIPYYKQPQNLSFDDIVNPFDNFLETIDELYELRILGGEPFIYPYLSELIEYYNGNDKIKKIIIFTNSTLVPSDKTMEKLKKKKVFIHMSDYGECSNKIKELKEKCLEYGVEYYIHQYVDWKDMGTIQKRNYDDQVVKKVYKTCSNAKCPSFYRGKLYICPRAAHGESIGAFNNLIEEYVDFLGGKIDTVKKRKEITKLLYERESFNACNYCNGNNMHTKTIKAAIQLKKE